MGCNKPLHGWFSKAGGFTMSSSNAYLDYRMSVPCGQCMGCRLAKTRDWAARISNEAALNDYNCFLTLTYNADNVPEDMSLCKSDLQKFFKRLRKYEEPKKIRYYACGEYGDIREVMDPYERRKYINKYGSTKLARPHYHAVVFGYWPKDSEKIAVKDTPYEWWYSEKLEKLWNKGFVRIGEVNWETAAYTASYVTKKIGKDAMGEAEKRFHYKGRQEEFAVMSRGGKHCAGRPGGIGRHFYEKYKEEIWNNNSIISRGREISPPRYYKNRLKAEDPDKAFQIKLANIRSRLSEERMENTEEYLVKKQEFFRKKNI